MITIEGGWQYREDAWVSEILRPQGNIWLEVELPSYGYIVIRQIDHKTEKAPKCYQSRLGKVFKLRVFYCPENDIQIYTSEIPKRIEYANI